MNPFRHLRPLALRDWAFSRFGARLGPAPETAPGRGWPLVYGGRMPALCPTDVAHRRLAWTGLYDLPLSRQIARLARSGGLLLDVGANAGYFTILWCAARADNRVAAFEPCPANVRLLRQNLAANGWESRVQVHPVAAGRGKGSLPFMPGPAGQTGWGGLAPSIGSSQLPAATFPVPVCSLDQLFPHRPRIRVLKVDTEGADAWVIQGARGLLARGCIEQVFFEENLERMQALGIEPGTAAGVLRECGYRVVCLEGGEVGGWEAVR